MSTPTRTRRLVQGLSLILLAFAGFTAITAIALPITQLATEAPAVATYNLTPDASRETLANAPVSPTGQLPPTGESTVQLTPAFEDELTINVRAATTPGGEPVPWTYRVATTLGTTWWALALAIMLYLLARILLDIGRGTPFTQVNVRRLVALGAVFLIGSVGADTINYLTARSFYELLGLTEPLLVTPYYSLLPWLLSGLAFATAAAFQSARQLQDDVEGLV